VSPKAKIGLIFLVCAAPIVFGTAAWYFHWGTPGTANYGELIAPRTLEAPAFQALRGKWLLLTFDPSLCSAECEKKLFVVRQVRRAQGAGAERIERVWIVTDGGMPAAKLREAIEGTHLVPLGDAAPLDAFPAGDRRSFIYLADPLGNLIMRYPAEPRPEKMIKDLERLLKLSRIG
jgi:hypothetical protein